MTFVWYGRSWLTPTTQVHQKQAYDSLQGPRGHQWSGLP